MQWGAVVFFSDLKSEKSHFVHNSLSHNTFAKDFSKGKVLDLFIILAWESLAIRNGIYENWNFCFFLWVWPLRMWPVKRVTRCVNKTRSSVHLCTIGHSPNKSGRKLDEDIWIKKYWSRIFFIKHRWVGWGVTEDEPVADSHGWLLLATVNTVNTHWWFLCGYKTIIIICFLYSIQLHIIYYSSSISSSSLSLPPSSSISSSWPLSSLAS